MVIEYCIAQGAPSVRLGVGYAKAHSKFTNEGSRFHTRAATPLKRAQRRGSSSPIVAECSGVWAPEALKVLKYLAHAAAPHSGREPAVCYSLLLQELAVAIRTFRVRASLRRRFQAL